MTVEQRTRRKARHSQEERREAAAAALLDAALALIAIRGVRGATLADVGDMAGYSRGVAAHYFGSKAGLLQAAAEHVLDLYARQLADAQAHQGLAAILKFVEQASLPRNLEITRALYLMQKEAFFDTCGLHEIYVRHNRMAAAALEAQIRAGVARGEIRPDVDAASEATLLLAQTRGLRTQWLLAPDAIDLLKMKRDAVELVRRNLQCEAAA